MTRLGGNISWHMHRMTMRPGIVNLHWIGRFGNRMHQVAYGATYGRKNGVRFYLPSPWEGSALFKQQFDIVPDALGIRLNELYGPSGVLKTARVGNTNPAFEVLKAYCSESNACPLDYSIHCVTSTPYRYQPGTVCAFDHLCAYNEQIFRAMSRRHLQDVFAFSERVTSLDLFKRLEDIQGTYDVAHLRRGDVADIKLNRSLGNKMGASVLSLDSYTRAFKKFGFDRCAIKWVSDEQNCAARNLLGAPPSLAPNYCRYPEGSVPCGSDLIFAWLPDFLMLYFARTVFRGNSSFSFWACLLSKTATVYSPRLTRRRVYTQEDPNYEIDAEFEPGNHPHWIALASEACPNIEIPP